VTNHKKYLDELSNSRICALSKSSQLITRKGQSVTTLLSKNSPFKRWYYQLINDTVNIYIVKLSEKGKAFRFEVKGEIDMELLNLLTCDPVFPGYPYGLIDADRFARISNQERDYHKTMILAKARLADEQNSHEILDKLSY